MPNVLIVVLVLALIAALAAVVVVLRRQPTAPVLDENAIRRLLTETIESSGLRPAADAGSRQAATGSTGTGPTGTGPTGTGPTGTDPAGTGPTDTHTGTGPTGTGSTGGTRTTTTDTGGTGPTGTGSTGPTGAALRPAGREPAPAHGTGSAVGLPGGRPGSAGGSGALAATGAAATSGAPAIVSAAPPGGRTGPRGPVAGAPSPATLASGDAARPPHGRHVDPSESDRRRQQRDEAAAAATRDAAAQEAEALRKRSLADAARLRADAVAEATATLDRAKVEAAGVRAGIASERQRMAKEAIDALTAERTEMQRAEQRLVEQAASLADTQKVLAAEQERLRTERNELGRSRSAADAREDDLRRQAAELATRAAELQTRAAEIENRRSAQEAELTRISGLTIPAARAELLASQEEAVRRDAAFMIRRLESEAEATAKTRAREIVAEAVQRVASDQTAQSVVSVVHLPADEVKGRIIGREGRNIRTFETITGVNVIIDDTPEAVLLSCFDPVRREVGRITLQMLIDDGRIHPHRIEEAFERAGDEVNALCRRAAEDAMLDVGISDLHPELVDLVGRLKYRTSYGQNVLGHLVETSHIARIMAAEMGMDPKIVARGAFLHDIGKALTHEAQGSHAIVGAELARKYGESEEVAHCIEAHHDEVQPSTVEAVLTQAADSCSGGRPGARRESLESYVQRLERIEAIAGAKKGVEKVFAMQAGRELRVMVKPDVVDDLEAHVLAREVAKQIEEELTYPGQVRVTVIRESRATEIAR